VWDMGWHGSNAIPRKVGKMCGGSPYRVEIYINLISEQVFISSVCLQALESMKASGIVFATGATTSMPSNLSVSLPCFIIHTSNGKVLSEAINDKKEKVLRSFCSCLKV
jgi:hypothetical protein